MALERDHIVQLLHNLRLTLKALLCYGLQVTDNPWTTFSVPLSEWIAPVQDTILSFDFVGCFSPADSLHMLGSVTRLSISIGAIPGDRLEEYVPVTARHVHVTALDVPVTGSHVFRCAQRIWWIIKADRTALPNLAHITVTLPVYDHSDMATWRILLFLLHEIAQRRDIDLVVNLVIAYWHGGDSIEWRDPDLDLRRGRGGQISRIFHKPLSILRRLSGRAP
ncbi:hypothetical protein AURDEDRAFT_168008 [Auricularia subglabra TFB-10046 SS5]|nr:hypothetical protein AURDEDRAFT_168008 [Auricularia subglabra TFB-10046 SS5]